MIKKNGNGRYEFDPIGTVKMVIQMALFVGAILVFYFTSKGENEKCDAIQDNKIFTLELRAAQIEVTYDKINRKLDRLIKTTDSIVIVMDK